MAVIRLTNLRMVSLSKTAMLRGTQISHAIKEVGGVVRGSTGNAGIAVHAVCGSEFIGAVPTTSVPDPKYPSYFVYSTTQLRPCERCLGPGLPYWQLQRHWRHWEPVDLPTDGLPPGTLFVDPH